MKKQPGQVQFGDAIEVHGRAQRVVHCGMGFDHDGPYVVIGYAREVDDKIPGMVEQATTIVTYRGKALDSDLIEVVDA